MTTPAQGNLPGSTSRPPDPGFEASGLSPEEAERLAASFRPSWEFDEAPFAPASSAANGGLDASQIEALAGGLEAVPPSNGDSRIVPPHAPPQRVETHEPEVSVIIDRSITSAEIDAQRMAQTGQVRPHAPAAAPFAAPVFAPPPAAQRDRVAPVMRSPRSAEDSLELPASLKKSNKGLFIGLGVAVAAAALVLVIHGALSSPSETTTAATAAPPPAATAAMAEQRERAAIPSIPPPVAATAAPTQASPVPPPVVPAASPATPAPSPAPARNAAVTAPAKPQPHVAAPVVHHAAPRNPPKPAAGGIVRDNPF